jgi:hypothetical protein
VFVDEQNRSTVVRLLTECLSEYRHRSASAGEAKKQRNDAKFRCRNPIELG